jgi:hypothetical protein
MLINIDEVATSALVNTLAVVGRRITVAAQGRLKRRRADDLQTARWFETYQLTSNPPELPGLSPVAGSRVAAALGGTRCRPRCRSCSPPG